MLRKIVFQKYPCTAHLGARNLRCFCATTQLFGMAAQVLRGFTQIQRPRVSTFSFN